MQIAKFTTQTAEQTLTELKVTLDQGLTPDQVTALQKQFGSNALVNHHTTSWSILIRQFKSSFVYLLVGAPVLALVLGENNDCVLVPNFVGLKPDQGFLPQ